MTEELLAGARLEKGLLVRKLLGDPRDVLAAAVSFAASVVVLMTVVEPSEAAFEGFSPSYVFKKGIGTVGSQNLTDTPDI